MKILFVLSLILILSQLVNLSDSFYIDQDNKDLQEYKRQASGKFKTTHYKYIYIYIYRYNYFISHF
jgi:hypothetical protein